ncbi:DUF202 domain-containing protein [Nocardioides antri]|uniref:DUF202 domain-containing protein n=1 Tax=Nocardioides antri TaxID=2607659 RepID=A0A5B1M9T5_9ACTN|nr:DUF202 domain-containing protein [Nocardioides antri]KAA1428677.1 DUF202 domain-containing protein [Nocardioides antri]
MAGPVDGPVAPERDSGLQPERTSLAWSRTILGYLLVATVCLKAAPLSGASAVVSAVAFLGVAVVVALRRVPRYAGDLRQLETGRTRPPLLDVLALSSLTAALAAHWLWHATP